MSELAHEPVSWLMLERYALGELDERERGDVERALAASSEDRARLDAILGDSTELPPLPVLHERRLATRWITGLGLAAALALALVRPFAGVPDQRSVSDGVKGEEIAVVLHSERTGHAPSAFRDGERFKLLVTCPTWMKSRLTVLMFQGRERYQPLLPAQDLPCGNLVPWPGAFTLDGRDDVQVCVTWSQDLAKLSRARTPRELEPEVVCTTVERE